MIHPRRRARLVLALLGPALLAAGLVFAGCRGEATPTETTTPTPGPNERFRSPASLQSYRYTLDIEISAELLDLSEMPAGLDVRGQVLVVEVEGTRVNPDQEQSTARTTLGQVLLERETILIGDRLWSRQSTGPWRQRGTLTGPEDLVGSELLLSPAVIFGEDDPEVMQRLTDDLLAHPHTFEMLRGREVRYWELDDEWFARYAEDFSGVLGEVERPEQIRIGLWGDIQTGIGIKLVVEAGSAEDPSSLRLEMELTDLNDRNLAVEEPRGAIGP